MNIGSFIYDGRAFYGVFDEEQVSPVSAEFLADFPTLRDALDAGALERLAQDAKDHTNRINCDSIEFLPPIPNPRKIICVGMNYPKPYPVDGVAPPNPENIILFGKERDTLQAHNAALEIPAGDPANSFDYEGEIAVVIGKSARNVSVGTAMDYVLGYSVFNDGSVRDWQRHSIYAGKNFADSGAWGPWITTVDDLPPPEEMHLSVSLNGTQVQSALGNEMIFSVGEQIAYVSSLFALRPGDVIATGSPDGTGGSRTPKRYLKTGDTVSMTVSGIGTLLNTVG
ncbi:2-keto-4-pentenoate hydratase/2-oxohepta-3-ene-1,7-dioic acid hydratase (catechol pathway) [Shimia gijangensis]|uniref:2-keto-4-pentenoate hydratase/2-oxohepta-3-ene-1,7-dioic acid hydratase (Catechol pathway) n=1 Tax=Shimia gijangensis TaxID=1470563 RepID=A0A1M6C8K8_9RHOB|nr:fumarylacetoacetate hydrolase family protein [Shimia gijangensis]SHI57367.1 2-keto-4-pentenoate hydratase/2-oxohepta-3-ene-1,7-dioic acid hydratase (catechol pathway) [Shimia gijangensis]